MYLVAEPGDAILSRLEPGSPVKVVPVAKQEVGSAGEFDLRVDPRTPIAAVGDDTPPGKLVTFHLVASQGNTFVVHVFSRYLRHTTSGDRWDDAANGGDSPTSGDQVSTTSASAVSAAIGGDVVIDLDKSNPGLKPDARPQDRSVSKGCSSTLIEDLGARWALVGQAYNSPVSYANFTYTTSASSSLGVGFSYNGAYGSWSSNGTKSVSSFSTQTYPTLPFGTNGYFDSQFHYQKIYYSCVDPFSGLTSSWMSAEPVGYAGGARTRNPASAPNAPYCVPEPVGSSFTKENSAAIQWTDGVEIRYYLGIDLSVQTGYSSSAKVTFNFVRNGKLCGTGDYPGGTPRQLVSSK